MAPARKSGAAALLANPHLLGVALILTLVAGASALLGLPRIEDPRITTRNALVLTTLPGATAARIEALVTEPIEVALRELSEVKTVESTSRRGISLVSLELHDRVTKKTNAQAFARIRDKLGEVAGDLPANASTPTLDDERGAVAFSLIASIEAPDDAQLGLSSRLANELADRLRTLPGTELVRLYGEAEEEISVRLGRDEATALGLTPGRVADLLRRADARQPAGAVRGAQHDQVVEVAGQFETLARVSAVPIAQTDRGGLLRLGDVAAIDKTVASPVQQLAIADGKRAVLVAARVEDGVRLEAWTARATHLVEDYAEEVGAGINVSVTYDQSRYTGARLALLTQNLLGGAGLVLLVVWFGLGFRAALIVGTALPLSAALTMFGLASAGQSIHQMSIFGMIIAVGLLIDNAIVVTDRVQENLRRGKAPGDAVADAVNHLKVPLAASTLTTVLGFMPVFLLPGNVGDFVSPIAISVILALLASLAIALTLTAALAGRFLKPAESGPSRWWRDGWSNVRVTRAYRRVLGGIVAAPRTAITAALVLPLVGFALASQLEMEFFPSADRDQFEVEIRAGANSAIGHTANVARAVDQAMREFEGIERVDWSVGGSYPSVYYNLIMNMDNAPNYAHGIVTMRDAAIASRTLPRLQRALNARFPNAQIIVSAFGQGPPVEAPVEFRITGPDPVRLAEYGEALRRIMQATPGIEHTRASVTMSDRKLVFDADESRARLVGLTLADISAQLNAGLEGARGGVLLEDLESLPVRVRYEDRDRQQLGRIETLGLVVNDAAGGSRWIPSLALGEWRSVPELSAITRRDGERLNKVLATITPGELPISVSQAVEARLAEGSLPLAAGYQIETGGSSEEQGDAVGLLLTYAPALGVLMIGLLVLSFSSVSLAGVIGAVALMSVGLGMASLWLAGYPLGFNPLIGTAGLVGVAINGSIVVLAALENDPSARAGNAHAVADVTVMATRHILATTCTTVGGFMPLLMFMEGSFWPPLAVVIAGGVGLSVIASLIFTPALYTLLRRRRPQEVAHPDTASPQPA